MAFVLETNALALYVHRAVKPGKKPSMGVPKWKVGACFAQKSGVSAVKTFQKPADMEGGARVYVSAISIFKCPNTNEICREKTVDNVREWLKKQNCPISVRGFDQFMRRVLRLVTMAQARRRGVDVDLLRAVRIRYQMPVDPRRTRALLGRRRPAHHARARRWPIAPRSEKPPPPPRSARPRPISPVEVVAPSVVEPPPPKMRGTPEAPQGYGDWKIINDMARKKVFAKDRSMLLNHWGTVIHIKTRYDYTQDELERDFGLTPNEAESCFMTFTT